MDEKNNLEGEWISVSQAPSNDGRYYVRLKGVSRPLARNFIDGKWKLYPPEEVLEWLRDCPIYNERIIEIEYRFNPCFIGCFVRGRGRR